MDQIVSAKTVMELAKNFCMWFYQYQVAREIQQIQQSWDLTDKTGHHILKQKRAATKKI